MLLCQIPPTVFSMLRLPSQASSVEESTTVRLLIRSTVGFFLIIGPNLVLGPRRTLFIVSLTIRWDQHPD